LIGSTKQRACVCSITKPDTYTSPLLQVHWKRLIVGKRKSFFFLFTASVCYFQYSLNNEKKKKTNTIDEGHRLSSKNRQSELSSKLFCNWKWVCTGTPTQNLTESATTRTRQASESDDLKRFVM
jgi:hypothetical protein